MWPDYHYDKDGVIRPNNDAPKINFDKFLSLLLKPNTEVTQKEVEEYLSTNKPKFLDSKVNMTGNRVMLASYPRSGNSFFRKILE